MSGIFGFSGIAGYYDRRAVLEKMSRALPEFEPISQSHWVDEEASAGFGYRKPERVGGPSNFAVDSNTSVCCVLDGVVFRESDAASDVFRTGGASLLLKRYLQSGIECLATLNGSFNVAWWDGRTKELVVATDRIGQRPMYYAQRAGKLVFGSSIASLMVTDVPIRQIDPIGLADLINYGYILGERTLFESLKTLPPGTALSVRDGEFKTQEYWRLDRIEVHGRYDSNRLEELDDRFKAAVRRCVPQDVKTAVGLTGGLDSRCIFAAAVESKLSFVTHTGGQRNSTDVDIARQLSALENVPHIFEQIGSERLAEWMTPMVLHQGGMVATLYSHPCQHFDAGFEFDVIVQGIGATYARGNWVTPGILGMTNPNEILEKLRDSMLTPAAKQLQTNDLWQTSIRTNVDLDPTNQLRGLMGQYQVSDSAVAIIDYIANRERVRKFLNKAVVIVRNCRDTHYPFLDQDFMVSLAALPLADRVNNSVLTDLMKRWNPKLLDVNYEKTLMPLSVSPLQKKAIRLSRAIRRRIGRKYSSVPPPPEKIANHYYTDWTRHELRPTITALLQNPNAAYASYLRQKTVVAALDQHFQGTRNWESLISALVVFEIAHGLWIDPT